MRIIFFICMLFVSVCYAKDFKKEPTIKAYSVEKKFPYLAEKKREDAINSKIKLIKAGMKKEEVMSMLPEPDSLESLYSYNNGTSSLRGFRINYILSQAKEKGTIKERGYKGISIDFDESFSVVASGDLAEYKYFEIAYAFIGKASNRKYDIGKMGVGYVERADSCLLYYCEKQDKECVEKKKNKMRSDVKYITVYLDIDKPRIEGQEGGGFLRVYIEEDTDEAVCSKGIK